MARKNEITTDDGLNFIQEKLEKLREGLAIGLTREQACHFADISTSRFYQVLEKNKEHYEEGYRLVDKIEKWEEKLNIEAKKNISNAIKKENNVRESKWWLEKKEDEFKDKVDVTSKGEPVQVAIPNSIAKRYTKNEDETTSQETESEDS